MLNEGLPHLIADHEIARRAYLTARAALVFVDGSNPALNADYADLVDGAAPWREAIMKLEQDADAPLP